MKKYKLPQRYVKQLPEKTRIILRRPTKHKRETLARLGWHKRKLPSPKALESLIQVYLEAEYAKLCAAVV